MKGESIRKGTALKPKDMLQHNVKCTKCSRQKKKCTKWDFNIAIANVTNTKKTSKEQLVLATCGAFDYPSRLT